MKRVFIMKSVIGYGVAIVGIVVMALGFNIFTLEISLLEGISANIISGAGIILIIGGIILSMMDKRSGNRKGPSQAREEVPIYKGTGKNRVIVGYQKD